MVIIPPPQQQNVVNKNDLDNAKSELQNNITNLENEININVTTKINNLQQQITGNDNDIQGLKNKDTQLQNNINTAKNDLTNLINSTKSDLQQQITTITDNLGIVSIKKYNKNGYDWIETEYTDGSTYLECYGSIDIKNNNRINLPKEVLANKVVVLVSPPYYCSTFEVKTYFTIARLSINNLSTSTYFYIRGKIGTNPVKPEETEETFSFNKDYTLADIGYSKEFSNVYFAGGNYTLYAVGKHSPNGVTTSTISVDGLDSVTSSEGYRQTQELFIDIHNAGNYTVSIWFDNENGGASFPEDILVGINKN